MLKYNLSANIVIHHYAIYLEYACTINIIRNNPDDKVQKPKVKQFIAYYFTQTYLNTLFGKYKDNPLEYSFSFSFL